MFDIVWWARGACHHYVSAIALVTGHAFARPVGFGHHTDCELICLAGKRNLGTQPRQNNTTGKSVKTCRVPRAEIFRFRSYPNHRHNSARLTRMRGARERHERAVRCDGRGRRRRRTRLKRTAKSCGSDVAVLALRSGEAKLLWDNGGKRAVLRGEHEVSRKAIAQGRPECSRCPVCSCAALAMRKQHTRPRVQQAPGLPCAL